jgi:UDP-N-acetylglucosamine acyltransferase
VKIHPTAIVHQGARLESDAEVGPYSIIGSNVVIGPKCVVQSHVVIEGIVNIGTGNFIGHGAIIGGCPQDLSFNPKTQSRVEIGNDNVIREHCTIHRSSREGSATVIGDSNFLMVGVHLAHDCRVGNRVVIANNALFAGFVQIDDGAFIAGGSRFHQNSRIGRLVMAEGGFSQSIPPFAIAGRNYVFGVNILGLRRARLTPADRDEVKQAFKLLYKSGLNTSQALEAANKSNFGPLGREFFSFVSEVGKRGIVPYKPSPEGDD